MADDAFPDDHAEPLPEPEPLDAYRPEAGGSGPVAQDAEEPVPEPEPLDVHEPPRADQGGPAAAEEAVDEPLPEPEPLDDHGAPERAGAGDRPDAEGWVHYSPAGETAVPPLREVTAPNERDGGADPAAGPIAAWTFSDLRDAAGRASCTPPEEERPHTPPAPAQPGARQPDAPPGPPPVQQPPEPPQGPAAPWPAPAPPPPGGPQPSDQTPHHPGHQRGRTPFWGVPAAPRPDAVPHAAAAGPYGQPGPARPPSGPRDARQPGPRFAPAYPPAAPSPAASITQGRPYVPPVPLPGPPVPTGPQAPPSPAHPRWESAPNGVPVRFGPPRSAGPASWPQPRFSGGAEDDVVTGMHRLHGATAVLQAAVVTLVFLALPAPFLLPLGPGWLLLALLAVALGSFSVALVNWYYTCFGLREDRLVVQTGPFRQRQREVPLSRLQAVDVVRPLFLQVIGLSELRVEVAGGDRAEIRLRYLERRRAERLRAALLAYAAGLSGRVPEAPETPLYQLRFSLLIGALVFRLPVLLAFVLFGLLIAAGLAFDEPGVLGGAVPLLLGLLRGFLGPLLRYIDFYASLSPDGLRLRYGVFQARMRTVPPGRVQAVRIVEPLLWRWLRVVRVEANIAGYAGQRQTESTTLFPVVPAALARELLRELFPGSSPDAVRFTPGPLEGSREELGVDDALFVTRRGRYCRVVEVVPHARMQAVRLRMGPLERWRGTAVVEVETPPGPVRAHVADRRPEEARALLDRIAGLARRARAASAGPERWASSGGPGA